MSELSLTRSDILAANIPNSSVVERMGITREPVAEYAARSSAAAAYRELWKVLDAELVRR